MPPPLSCAAADTCVLTCRALCAIQGIRMATVRARDKALREKTAAQHREARVENAVAAVNETGITYTVCGGCLELVPSDDYHDARNCKKREKRLEGERYVHYVLQEQMSQRERQRLRFAIGCEVVSEAKFLAKRDELWASIAEISPFHLDPYDNTSVWSTYDSTLMWMASVRHPPERDVMLCYDYQ